MSVLDDESLPTPPKRRKSSKIEVVENEPISPRIRKNRSRINMTSVEHSVKVTSVDILRCSTFKLRVVSPRDVCEQAKQRMRKCARAT